MHAKKRVPVARHINVVSSLIAEGAQGVVSARRLWQECAFVASLAALRTHHASLLTERERLAATQAAWDDTVIGADVLGDPLHRYHPEDLTKGDDLPLLADFVDAHATTLIKVQRGFSQIRHHARWHRLQATFEAQPGRREACRFVSVSADFQDCSWFRACRLDALQAAPGFWTGRGRVRRGS